MAYRLKPENGSWFLQRKRFGLWWKIWEPIGMDALAAIAFKSEAEGRKYVEREKAEKEEAERERRSLDGKGPVYLD